MQVRVYQIDPDRDKNRVMHERLNHLAKYQGSPAVDASLYDRVLRADVDCDSLEQLYTLLNTKGHPLHHGGQMKVSDVVVTDEGAFYCDRFGFAEIGFDESKAQIPADCMRVLYVEPDKAPFETEIPNTLEAEQQAVQGLIELVYLDHGAILVGNDESKLIGMEGNRVLDNGTIIAGPFFIAGDAGENFCSLTDEQAAHFMQRFQEPEDISQEDVQADTGFIFYAF